jgi:cytochrome P450
MGSLRVLQSSTCLVGVDLTRGDLIFVPPRAVNFDPAVFVNPLAFNPGRKRASRHLSFGMPPYDCPAASLARVQLSRIVAALARELPTLSLRGEPMIVESALYRDIHHVPVSIRKFITMVASPDQRS